MPKKKLATPAWITEGFDSPADYANAMQGTKSLTSSKQSKDSSTKGEKVEAPQGCNPKIKDFTGGKKKGKTFKIKRCPECNSDNIEVVGGEKPEWKCNKCKYQGLDVKEEKLTENEFMKYLDEKGEEVA